MPHVVLLGDSIFDNGAYVPGEPDVVAQLRAVLPAYWSASLCAVDGSVTSQVGAQLRRLPPDATHLVISTGGNDALAHIDILEAPARSAAETLARLAAIGESFESDYGVMLSHVGARALPFALCTIYNGSFPDPMMQRLAATALAVFNDVIVRQAIRVGAPLIDLRMVCRTPEDYANPIEPSAAGGRKIANVIARAVQQHGFEAPDTRVYV
jgi:lysophospholipase L1-like esterase